MIHQAIVQYIIEKIGEPIQNSIALAGSEFSDVFYLETNQQAYLLKVYRGEQAKAMALAEKWGFEAIAATQSIRTPIIYACGEVDQASFLLTEFIRTKKAEPSDFERLGHQLAALHQTTETFFGWGEDNFIGNLPQSNRQRTNWTSFYVHQRLWPQLKLARSKGLLSGEEVPHYERLEEGCQPYFQDIVPALLHGDYWNGNFLIASDGTPCLIDPAVYYGHHEVDLAMSRLFKGFDPAFYEAYHKHFPPAPGATERNDLYQLYFLLVHLNIFGPSYASFVRQTLNRYFS